MLYLFSRFLTNVETRRPSGSPVACGGKPSRSAGLTSRYNGGNPRNALAQISRLYTARILIQGLYRLSQVL